MVKKSDEFELVPHKRLKDLEQEVSEVLSSPAIKGEAAEVLGQNIVDTNKSINSLLKVLNEIRNDAKFDTKEESYIKHQIKPLVSSIHEVVEHNETISRTLINIIERLNDLRADITEIKDKMNPVPAPEPNLPPLSGGPEPPQTAPQPSSLNAQPVSGIPPMEKGGLKPKPFKK